MGLVVLEILGLEHTESPSPVSAVGPEKAKKKKKMQRVSTYKVEYAETAQPRSSHTTQALQITSHYCIAELEA